MLGGHAQADAPTGCVDNASYSFQTTDSRATNGQWTCADWIDQQCNSSGFGVETKAEIDALLHACQAACIEGPCHRHVTGTKYELLKENAECSSVDTPLGEFNGTAAGRELGLQACADTCASISDCEAFDFGRNGTDREGLCFYEKTATARCAEGWKTSGSSSSYDYYRLLKPIPPSPPLLPSPPLPPPTPLPPPPGTPWGYGEHGGDDGVNGNYNGNYNGNDYEYNSSNYGGENHYGDGEAVAKPNIERIRAGYECTDGPDIILKDCNDGDACRDQTDPMDCARLCAAAPNCTYFIYGVASKQGQCWQENTTDGCESESWEVDEFDFYRLWREQDNYALHRPPPPSPPAGPPRPQPSLPPPAPPVPPAAPPQAFFEKAIQEMNDRLAGSFLQGGLIGSVLAVALILASICVCAVTYLKCRKPKGEEDIELTEAVDRPL